MVARDGGEAVGTDAAKAPRWPDRIVLTALGLVVVCTAAVATNTTAIHWRTATIRAEAAAIILPALRATDELIAATAVELDALYRYGRTGDTAALAEYRESAADRRRASLNLRPLISQLSGEPARRSQILLQGVAEWEAAMPMARDGGSRVAPASRQFQHLESAGRQVLLAAVALEQSLRAELQRARAQIDAAERVDWYYTLALLAIATGAAVLIALLVKRVRYLADISERRRIQAEQAMESRARLIRGISHDLKNPLGVADGNAQLLQMGIRGPLSQPQQEMLARIRHGIGAAVEIVSDLLELSRAEAAQLEMHVSPTDVGRVLTAAADDHRFQAEEHRLAIECDVPWELPRITTDAQRVRAIVGNLVSNALKYTPAGGRVTLAATVTEHGPHGGGRWVALSVADTGPGIPPEDRERVFDEFYRADATATAVGGLGLGLAISRRVARALGGDITVESEVGKGSTFTLWLPADGRAVHHHMS